MTVKELRDILNSLMQIEGMKDYEAQVVLYPTDSSEGERVSISTVEIGDKYVAIDPFEKGVG